MGAAAKMRPAKMAAAAAEMAAAPDMRGAADMPAATTTAPASWCSANTARQNGRENYHGHDPEFCHGALKRP